MDPKGCESAQIIIESCRSFVFSETMFEANVVALLSFSQEVAHGLVSSVAYSPTKLSFRG
jgi:hypothetical protein